MNQVTPFIISGAPRSGTSLIYNLFDGHSDISWLVDEGYLFEYLHDLGPQDAHLFLDALPQDVDMLIAGLRDKQVMPPLHLDYTQSVSRGSVSDVVIETNWSEERFRDALQGERPKTVAGLFDYLSKAYLTGDRQDVRRFACLKSPDYGKSVKAALDLVDGARGLIILRDPLRAIDSLKRSRELRGEKLLTWPQILLSAKSFLDMKARIDAMDPERCRVIRYEDLLSDPKSHMTGIAEWLGVPYEDCLLAPTMRGQHWPGISSFKATDGIDPSAASRKLDALTAEETDFLKTSLAPFLQQYGYDA